MIVCENIIDGASLSKSSPSSALDIKAIVTDDYPENILSSVTEERQPAFNPGFEFSHDQIMKLQ